MIALAWDCLVFELGNGEKVPFSVDDIGIEVCGDTSALFDSEFVRDAANAVFHYFKHELERQSVSVSEFAEAMEKVLTRFASNRVWLGKKPPLVRMLETDLGRLADESGKDAELFFFATLRAEFRRQLQQTPRIVRFRGLRGCVKRLIGARRWSGRCRVLEEEIVNYLRQCLSAESRRGDFALVVD